MTVHHRVSSNIVLQSNVDAEVLPSPLSKLWMSIMKGDLKAMKEHIAKGGISLLQQPLNKYGWSALHTACYFGHLAIVQTLVRDYDMNVNQVNTNGWHSLIFAVYGTQIDVVDYLLFETQVDIDLKDISEQTAEDLALKLKDQDIINLIAERRNNISNVSSYSSLMQTLEDFDE